MLHSSSKYFPKFENQGINPVGVSSQVSKVPAQKQTTCTQRFKWVVNPFKIVCKVRSEGEKCNEVKKYKAENMVRSRRWGHSVH